MSILIYSMKTEFCPNHQNCQIITVEGFVNDLAKKDYYIKSFCQSTSGNWENCKRLITKTELNFCPNFVFPDSALSLDEIIDKCESEII